MTDYYAALELLQKEDPVTLLCLFFFYQQCLIGNRSKAKELVFFS